MDMSMPHVRAAIGRRTVECLLVGRIYVDLRRVASAACPVEL